MSGPHPLLDLFLAAAGGRFPPVDGGVTVVEPLPGGLECSVAFTGHAVVATALPADEVRAAGPDGYGASLAPDFLRLLAGPHGTVGVTDATLTAPGAAWATPPRPPGRPRRPPTRAVRPPDPQERHGARGRAGPDHPRRRARHGWRSASNSTTRTPPPCGGPRRGRGLLADALTLVPRGRPVFAAVAPGNARSLRAFLAAGFVPVGSEVIIAPGRG